MHSPRYPKIRVKTRSPNPLALVAAVREEMRLAGVDRHEIARFSDEALADGGVRQASDRCQLWVTVEESA